MLQANEVLSQTKERMWCQSTVKLARLLLLQIETDSCSSSAELWATIPVPTHTAEQRVT